MSSENPHLSTQSVQRVRGREDYAVHQCLMKEVSQVLQVSTPDGGFFATVANTRCKEFLLRVKMLLVSRGLDGLNGASHPLLKSSR